MRFLHCADLHLDSPLLGLERYEGAPAQEMRATTRRSFSNIIDLALEREVDFVLIAGDVFDNDWLDFNAGLFFVDQLRRLADAAVRVFIVSGNHDAANKISRSVPLPKHVTWFDHKAPSTVVDEERLGIAIHGQSFATGIMREDLASRYPEARPGLLNLGLLHTSLSGREGKEHYAPTTVERLATKGYHYWALGHVHKRVTVCEDPWIVFSGNIQGRHARELGPKGCLVVEGDAEGIRSAPEFVATDVARWAHLSMDTTDLAHLDDLEASVQQEVQQAVLSACGRPLALRLSFVGRTALHGDLVRDPDQCRANLCAWINEASGGTAWLEKVRVSVTAPMDRIALAKRDDPMGLLLRRCNELNADPEAMARITDSVLSEVWQKMPVELRNSALGTEALQSAQERLLAELSREIAL